MTGVSMDRACETITEEGGGRMTELDTPKYDGKMPEPVEEIISFDNNEIDKNNILSTTITGMHRCADFITEKMKIQQLFRISNVELIFAINFTVISCWKYDTRHSQNF